MKSNRACGFYDIIEPEKIMPEPEWPDMSFADMLQIAFNDDHIVDRDDHLARDHHLVLDRLDHPWLDTSFIHLTLIHDLS